MPTTVGLPYDETVDRGHELGEAGAGGPLILSVSGDHAEKLGAIPLMSPSRPPPQARAPTPVLSVLPLVTQS